MSSIDAAINDLYETFERYPRPAAVECCPCGCTKPDAASHLLVSSLRELRFLDLADYSFSAMTTQGSVDDFRYFLPRLFQGVVESLIPILMKPSFISLATRNGQPGR